MLSVITGLKFKKRSPAVGARPGTLVIDERSPPTTVRMISYTREDVQDLESADAEQLAQAREPDSVTWVNVEGFGDEEVVRKVGDVFQLHPLAMEDVVNAPQRPKCDSYGDQIVIIVRMVRDEGGGRTSIEQVGIVIGRSYVITFQERHGDVLEPVRQRIRLATSRLRKSGPDYLAYVILDTIVDAYYPVLESLGDQLESLETEALERPTPAVLRRLNEARHQLLHLRRAAWPQRDAVIALSREEDRLSDEVRLYLRDTYDHAVQAAEVLEMYREMASGLLNTYMSAVAHRTNEVMKTLTIIASIFIPLTFVAGIYGMNFEHMPELHYRWGYPVVWLIMTAIVVGLLIYYRRRGWLDFARDRD